MRKIVGKLDQGAKGLTSLYKVIVTGFLIYELMKFRFTKWRRN